MRLVKEKESYVQELQEQKRAIRRVEEDETGDGEDGNRTWRLGQVVCFVPSLRLHF